MKLYEIFEQLSAGELSQLAIATDPARMIPHINLGIHTLYKRFPLKQNSLSIQLQPDQLTYILNSKYAVTGRSTQAVRYIKDSGNPFKDDILKVEKVTTDIGFELGLNDEADTYSVFTPVATTLVIPDILVHPIPNMPEELITENLKVVYRANHAKVPTDLETYDLEDLKNFEIELPYTHLEALLYFVAARLHTPIGMVNEANMGNIYAVKYEQACQQIEQYNLRVDQFSEPDRATRMGWV